MPEGPFGGPRPASNSTLKMVVRETPVPTNEDTGVFPDIIIKIGADVKNIREDISTRTGLELSNISINRRSNFIRGLGQTDTFVIKLDVSGETPDTVSNIVRTLTRDGYLFETVVFE